MRPIQNCLPHARVRPTAVAPKAHSHRAPLLAALLLGLSTQAGAVSLNPDGQGQVLLFPYYSVNGGLVTVMSLTNHTDRVKAVKVRFLEAQNSREALQFNLHLSPFDQWTGALIDAGEAEGPAILLSEDTSCIAPMQVPAGGQAFVNYQYSGANADGGPTGLDRTRDGHIEIVEMGVVSDGQGAEPFELATAATHNPELLDEQGRVLPNDCGKIQAAWQSGGVWRVAPNTDDDVSPPTGGLSGSAAIVDVAQGIAYSYAATAIEGFYERPDVAHSPLHAFPGSILPNLAQAEDLIADPEGGTATAIVVEGNVVTHLSFQAPRFNAISALLTRDTLSGEFATGASMGASTEWLLTFPTRGLHEASGANRRPFRPLRSDWPCPEIDFRWGDREGPELSGEVETLPLPGAPELPRERYVCSSIHSVRINTAYGAATTPLLQRSTELSTRFEACTSEMELEETGLCDWDEDTEFHDNGWMQVRLGHSFELAEDGQDPTALYTNFIIEDVADEAGRYDLVVGMPVLGLEFARYVNGQVEPGVLANYSTLKPLTGRREHLRVQGLDENGHPIPVPDESSP